MACCKREGGETLVRHVDVYQFSAKCYQCNKGKIFDSKTRKCVCNNWMVLKEDRCWSRL